MTIRALIAGACALLAASGALAQPGPVEADWVARDFRFHTGEVMAELRLHYTTLGAPSGEPVLILHGTAQSGAVMLAPTFGGRLFGPGQPLDAARYFIILPDAIGTGQSAKPSDGLHARFPAYDYDDMVLAQYRLVSEGLGLRHLRLVLGNSMGGMQTWLWAEQHPGFADGWVPMASQPSAMASRNWMMRRMLVETIRQDPAYHGGEYDTQPPSLRYVNTMFGIATSGGTLGYQAQAPTAAQANALVDRLLAQPLPADANDYVFQWNSSGDYDAWPGLGRITAPVLAINSADDERNPPESGITDRAMDQLHGLGHLVLIPESAETRGHGTTAQARFWAEPLRQFLLTLPH